jgi:hypothetical protein
MRSKRLIYRFLKFVAVIRAEPVESVCVMDTSLISAFIGAQVGEMQLAVAARLASMNNANNESSIAQLVDVADQSASSLANVTAGIGTNLDISA